MEGQLQRPTHGHHQCEEDPHNAGLQYSVEGEHNQHHGEKKSVLRKVKDKAKKIKETITKHGHDHEHEHHEYRHVSEEEDDDDDEAIVNDPEVHGAPIYESAAVITGTNLPMQTGVNLEKPTDIREDRLNPRVKNEAKYTNVEDTGVATRPFGMDKMEPELGRRPVEAHHESKFENPLQRPTGGDLGETRPFGSDKMETDLGKRPFETHHEPEMKDHREDIGVTRPFGSDKMETALGRQPFEAHYEPKIKDQLQYPTGEDIGVTRPFGAGNMKTELGKGAFEAHHESESKDPLDDPNLQDIDATRPFGLDKMETELGRQPIKTAHHEPDIKNPLQYPDVNIGGTGSDMFKMETEWRMPTVEGDEADLLDPPQNEPFAVEMEEAEVVEPAVKIGPLMGLEEDPHSPKNRPGQKIHPSNYQSKVADPTGEGGKEADVGPLARRLDNVHIQEKSESKPTPERGLYTGSHDQFAPQPTPIKEDLNPESNPLEFSQNPESPKHYDSAKPESMPRDTITGKISSATHVIADKAVSVKNVVASKLGYGGGQHQESQETTSKKPVSETAADYGHTVAEKLTPVYEKVAGAGSAILSKVQGSGGAAEHESGDMEAKAADKGVSVKEYLAVKLRPGDEDKALSEVITEALQRKKEAVPSTVEEHQVVESENVVADLGTGTENKREREDEVVAASESSGGGGMVDRLKGAVSSWLGKGTGSAATSGGVEHREEEISN